MAKSRKDAGNSDTKDTAQSTPMLETVSLYCQFCFDNFATGGKKLSEGAKKTAG
jgi:hypothetical protein